MESSSSLREAVLLARPRTPNMGYPEDIRARVTHFARARRAAGDGWQKIGDLVGLSRSAVRNWATHKSDVERGFVSVSVVPAAESAPGAPPGGGVELVSPRGYRVTGLDVESVAALLSRLG